MSPVAPLPGLPGGAHAAAANASAMTATRGVAIRQRRAGCHARLPPVGVEATGGPVTAVGLGGVSLAMAERLTERVPLVIQRVSTGPQLRRCVPIAQGGPSP